MIEPLPSKLTVGEMRGWVAAVTGLTPEQVGPVVVVVGMMYGPSPWETLVIPPMLGEHEPDWKQAIMLMASGIRQVAEVQM